MQLINPTGLCAAWTLGFQRDGRELAIVVAKASYRFDAATGAVELAETQDALVQADEFSGAPGLSAILRETDFAHFKPHCDVLLNGCAHAPPGMLARWLNVELRVGALTKTFKVVGDRVWQAGRLAAQPGPPQPFATLPITYDRAFGGVDDFATDAAGEPLPPACYLANPVGRGYHLRTGRKLVDGTPLPNTEQLGRTIEQPDGDYAPMAFGAIGRNFALRYAHAGTYDETWLKTKAPFWPDDFRYDYFQAAPPDQQRPYLSGGEAVTLRNLTPQGTAQFVLPRLDLAVLACLWHGTDTCYPMAVDTLLIEPQRGQFSLTCRVGIPMPKSIFDIRELVLDHASALTQREFRHGKPHYRSPADYALAQARGRAR